MDPRGTGPWQPSPPPRTSLQMVPDATKEEALYYIYIDLDKEEKGRASHCQWRRVWSDGRRIYRGGVGVGVPQTPTTRARALMRLARKRPSALGHDKINGPHAYAAPLQCCFSAPSSPDEDGHNRTQRFSKGTFPAVLGFPGTAILPN